MSKLLKLLLISVFIMVISSCGGNGSSDDSNQTTDTNQTTNPSNPNSTTIINQTPFIVDIYKPLTPKDANISYDESKFVIISGEVTDIDNQALDNVKISIKNHTEYGSTFTDINGSYDLPIHNDNLVVEYSKSGYLTSQRNILLKSNMIVNLPKITLIKKDSKQTIINLNTSTSTTHISTLVSDARGERRSTVVFPSHLKATLIKPNGDRSRLTNLHFSSSEYTTPESMPATLPSVVAFTYCTNLNTESRYQ